MSKRWVTLIMAAVLVTALAPVAGAATAGAAATAADTVPIAVSKALSTNVLHHAALELTRTAAAEVEYWPTPDPSVTHGSREQRLDAGRDVLLLLAEQLGNAAQRIQPVGDQLGGPLAGHRLDPPQAGADAGLAGDHLLRHQLPYQWGQGHAAVGDRAQVRRPHQRPTESLAGR